MPAKPARITAAALERVLDRRPDPLGVLMTTARVVSRARHVAIDPRRIQTVAQLLSLREVPIPEWNYQYHFFDGTARTVNYLFLLDALNFSFWGEPRWTIHHRGKTLDGYWALAAALKRAAESNPDILEASYLAELTPEELARMLRGQNRITMFVERWHNVQELGRVLRDQFGGSAARVVESAEKDAPRLARLIAQHFSSFNDTTVYDGHAVNLFKRAQILVADLYGSFQGKSWGRFKNISELTAFADYKLPQILRGWGILRYDARLARKVNRKEELRKNSDEEIEIRAGMLWAVELLREALAARGRELTSVQMDWFLWESSQHLAPNVKPYHRVRTIYY